MLAGMLVGACEHPTTSAARTLVRDSAGVAIMDNPDTGWSESAGWRVDTVPTLSFGTDEGEEPYRFNGISGIQRQSDGTIVVADAAPDIRFYDSSGKFLHRVGRGGAGPGEYRFIVVLSRYAGDSLAAVDDLQQRVTYLSPTGVLTRMRGFPRVPGYFFTQAVTPAGALAGIYDVGVNFEQQSDGVLSPVSPVVVAEPESSVLDTLASLPSGHSWLQGSSLTSMPFSAGPKLTAEGNHVWVARADQFELLRYRTDGVLERIVRLDYASRRVSDSMRQSYIQYLLDRARTTEARDRITALYKAMPFPETLPTFGDVKVDAEGNVWAAEYRASSAQPTTWYVFRPDGTYLGSLTTPASFEVFDISSKDVAGVMTDSLGVERVEVLSIHK